MKLPAFYLAITVMLSMATHAHAVPLMIDVDDRDTLNTESGFTSLSLTGGSNVGSVVVDGVTVTVTGQTLNHEIDRNAGGDLLRDFVWGNPFDVTVSITGLTPNRDHDLTLYSIDVNNNAGHTLDVIANGVNLGSLTEPAGAVPIDPSEFTVTGIATSTPAGVINIVLETPGVLAGPPFSKINGFILNETFIPTIPEPSSLGLLMIGAAVFARKRRKRPA